MPFPLFQTFFTITKRNVTPCDKVLLLGSSIFKIGFPVYNAHFVYNALSNDTVRHAAIQPEVKGRVLKHTVG